MSLEKDNTCAIVVFGDIGRSPRMQNHALMISQNCQYKKIYLVGNLGILLKLIIELFRNLAT